MTASVGTGTLVRLILRRDRVVLAGWVTAIVLVGVGTVAYYLGVFASAETRQAVFADIAGTPALLGFNGQLFGDSLDILATWRMRDLSYTLVSVMTLMTVVRHTRREEDHGRLELVGSAAIGRHAPLAAAICVAAAAGVAASLLIGLGMIGLGLDPAGALAFAAAASATGAVFAGVGAVAAQIVSTGRGALGLGATVLGLSYLLRFTADSSGATALSWVTPLGWAHQIRPFADERWAVLLLPLAAAIGLAALAHALLARRDFGAGLLPARNGPARGHTSAAWPAWRGGNSAAYSPAGPPPMRSRASSSADSSPPFRTPPKRSAQAR
ncbi:MAG: hypothetical protein IPL41_10955 [Micropruina sp.]|nr:hypothetical protein [Micropruina sp.]